MRIVHLASQHPADDVRIFLKECRSLANAGFEVHYVAPEAVDHTRDGVILHGFQLPGGYRPLRILRRLWRVWRVACDLRPDLCHFHEPVLLPVALLLKLRGARIVYDVHEDWLSAIELTQHREGWKRFGVRWFEDLARRVCDGFVGATPAIARRFPAERTIEVLNYALPEEFPDRPGPAATGADVVYLGLIERARGLEEMLEAIARVRNPEARIVMIGDFNPPDLEQEARARPGWSRVVYLGRLDRPAVADQLAAARAGLVLFHPESNHTEALPNKLFEYMAAGLPLVASDFPFWRSLLEPIGCAVQVDPLDPGQIAAAIDDLLAHETRASEMGRRGAAAVIERLNWQHEAPKLVELYERLGLRAAA